MTQLNAMLVNELIIFLKLTITPASTDNEVKSVAYIIGIVSPVVVAILC